MAEKEGIERKVWLLPTELVERLKAYQTSQGISSEVEAARRLLDSALQMRDSVIDLLRKLSDRFGTEKDMRVLARDVLVSHTLVTNVRFEEGDLAFTLSNGEVGRLDKKGQTFIADPGQDFNGDILWRPYPQASERPQPSNQSSGLWDPPKANELDDEIPF